jgi:hypothetical protein
MGRWWRCWTRAPLNDRFTPGAWWYQCPEAIASRGRPVLTGKRQSRGSGFIQMNDSIPYPFDNHHPSHVVAAVITHGYRKSSLCCIFCHKRPKQQDFNISAVWMNIRKGNLAHCARILAISLPHRGTCSSLCSYPIQTHRGTQMATGSKVPTFASGSPTELVTLQRSCKGQR